ncbi:MAG: hypothetical protein J1F12_03615 [Muribaculaceae bacterium]|nr:hypothetical protein [Muribaculaceae bacterium]
MLANIYRWLSLRFPNPFTSTVISKCSRTLRENSDP